MQFISTTNVYLAQLLPKKKNKITRTRMAGNPAKNLYTFLTKYKYRLLAVQVWRGWRGGGGVGGLSQVPHSSRTFGIKEDQN